jgi:hypothetical protein
MNIRKQIVCPPRQRAGTLAENMGPNKNVEINKRTRIQP